MPKRSHNNDEDYLRRKLRKIEKKLAKYDKRSHNRASSHSSVSTNVSPEPVLLDFEPDQEDESQLEPELVSTIIDESQPGTSTSSAAVTASDTLQAEMSTETGLAVDPPELDEEILILLGEAPSKDKKYGPEIRCELAVRWEHISTTGLCKDSRKALCEKHLVPKNCTKIDAPKLNPEIKAALSEMLFKKDKAIENKQKQVAASISCISEALTRLFTLEHRDQSVIKLLVEAGQLMCDTQHKESMTRRSFICSSIKKDIKDQLYNTEIDSFLFGEKLAETLKAAKAISKSGAELKPNPPVKKSAQKPRPALNLNQKPPFPAARQAGAARRSEPTPTTTSRSRQPQQQRPPPRSQHHPGPRR